MAKFLGVLRVIDAVVSESDTSLALIFLHCISTSFEGAEIDHTMKIVLTSWILKTAFESGSFFKKT